MSGRNAPATAAGRRCSEAKRREAAPCPYGTAPAPAPVKALPPAGPTLQVGPWRDVERPADADEPTMACWRMAALGSSQHPQAVRALWEGERVRALGGVIQTAAGEGYVFYHAPRWPDRPALGARGWRLIWNTVHSIVWWAHQRGLGVVTAMVAASHVEGHRLIRRMGFEPYGWAPGFAGLSTPMMRYLHVWPAIEEPALVRHQRHELWRAELGAWCPAYLAELDRQGAQGKAPGLPALVTTPAARRHQALPQGGA